MDARLSDAIRQLAGTMSGGAASQPTQGPPGIPQWTPGTAVPDPWAASAAARAAECGTGPSMAAPPSLGVPGPRSVYGGDGLSKDFSDIAVFDGDLASFPDWSDRIVAKLSRAHLNFPTALAWAEQQADPITEEVEVRMSAQGVSLVELSLGLFDVLMERTGQRIYDKRRNAGKGRGPECWRILKRDFGASSVDAQLAKLQAYMKPGRCTSVQELGAALDRWEALGRESTKPVDDDFRLLALRALVPRNFADVMSTQVSFRNYPEARMCVRCQVAEVRHTSQV